MPDLVTRLRLDNKEFDDNIKKSKQQIQTFKDVGASLTTAMKGMAVGLGVVTTAGEVFNKMMSSSQTFGDNMSVAIEGAKSSVDAFFYTLSTGDFSVFMNGLDNIIKRAGDVQSALDQLGNTRMSYSFVRGETRRDIANAKIQANNTNLSDEERQNGFDNWGKGLKESERIAKNLESDIQKAVIALSEKDTKLSKVSIEAVKDIARIDILNDEERSKKKEELSAQYQQYQKELSDLANGDRKSLVVKGKILSYEEQQTALANKYGEAVLYNNELVKKSDEEWQGILSMLEEAANATEELGSQTEEYNNALKTFQNGNTNKESNPLIPEGTIEDLEKQIAAAKAQLKVTVDEPSRIKLYKEIKALEERVRVIKFRYENTDSKGSDFITSSRPSLAGMANMPTMKIPSSNNNKLKKGANAANDYADALSNCATAIAVFNGSKLEDNGEGWTQWSSNLLAAAASTIIGLQSLTMAKGVNSAFDLPFPANIAAAAMVLSTVISLFSSIPAFANGGIFESSLTTGDRNIARLNGGEMILNKGQQYNLFKLLDNGSPMGNGGQVQFKISGKELVGVLANYNNKVSKVR